MGRIADTKNPFYAGSWTPLTTTVTLTAEAANARTATIQLKNRKGSNLSSRTRLQVYLSDDANGAGLAAAAPSGGVAVAGGVGTILNADVAGKKFDCLTNATGAVALAITEAAVKTFYLCVENPDGTLTVTAVAFA